MLVIEPHADDAFLSLGQIIEDWTRAGERATIMTVYSGTRKRAQDAQAYARAVKADWIGLGATEMGDARVNGAAHIGPYDPEYARLIRAAPIVLLPLGVGGHPEHVFVRDAMTAIRCQAQKPIWYYVDQPYACKQKNAGELSRILQGRRVEMFRKPGARKWRHIPLFKDQAKFFHFNPVETLRETFEMVVGGYDYDDGPI